MVTITGPMARYMNSGPISGDVALTVDGAIGTIWNTQAGQITGGSYGFLVDGAASGSVSDLVNAGTITGYDAIENTGSIGQILNRATGTIHGNRYAIANYGTGTVGTIINAGTIEGDYQGVQLGGTPLTIVNSGVIKGGTAPFADDVAIGGNFTLLTNTATGSIFSGYLGLTIINGQLNNAGTISGGVYGAFVDTNTSASIDNAGTISGPSAALVVWGNVATLTNTPTGHITGGTFGIETDATAPGSISNLVNGGTISASSLDAIENTGSIGGILNTATGTIHGNRFGIGNGNGNRIDHVTNAGTIVGDYQGISTGSAPGFGTLFNSGVIKGGTAPFFDDAAVNGSFKLLTNAASGTISSGGDGMWVASGVIHNGGTITGEGLYGVYVASNGSATIDNAGTITGGAAAIEVSDHAQATIIDETTGRFNGGNIGFDDDTASATLTLAAGPGTGQLDAGTIGSGVSLISVVGTNWAISGATVIASSTNVALTAGSTLQVGGALSVASFQFLGGAATVDLQNPIGQTFGTFDGFAATDQIVLEGVDHTNIANFGTSGSSAFVNITGGAAINLGFSGSVDTSQLVFAVDDSLHTTTISHL